METPFHGMTFEIPSDWIVTDYVESEYSYDVIAVQYADSTDPTYVCNVYYFEATYADDIEEFIEEAAEYDEEDGYEYETSITKIDGYTVGVISTYYDTEINTTCYVQTPDGGNMFIFYYPNETEEEMTAIIEYFLDSIEMDD